MLRIHCAISAESTHNLGFDTNASNLIANTLMQDKRFFGQIILDKRKLFKELTNAARDAGAMTVSNDAMWVGDGFQATVFWALHEIAHIFDNRAGNGIIFTESIAGGGPSDELATRCGGDPGCFNYLRFMGGLCGMKEEYKYDEGNWQLNYGNNSTADYFAHSFAFWVLNPSELPSAEIGVWFNIFFRDYFYSIYKP